MRYSMLLMAALVLPSVGCVHLQLKRNLGKQTQTLADLQEQQVLNNLAAFVASQGATPSFALPNGGGATMNHANTLNGGLNWNPTTLTSSMAGLNGSRSLTENWTLLPVNSPDKLDLMKSVYRYVTCKPKQDVCVDDMTKLTRYFGDNFGTCKLSQCFYSVTDKKPWSWNSNCCLKIGEHCGTYVVVEQANFECLSKLTLAILDIATISDGDLAKRLAGPQEKTVQVTDTFIAVIEDKPHLLRTEYSIKLSDFEKLQEKAVAISLGSDDMPAAREMDPKEDKRTTQERFGTEGLRAREIEILPPVGRQTSERVQQDVGANIGSLLQMNQVPIQVAP